MDEVKAKSRAGETVGKAVSSGWLAVRREAKRAGHAGAEATANAAHVADRKLTERGVAPRQLTEALAESAELAREEVAKTTRRTRKKLARTAKHTRKELAKAAKQARKEAKKSKPAKAAKKARANAKGTAKNTRASLKARAKEEAAARKLTASPKKRRRWPKVLLLAVAAAGVAYVARGKAAPQEPASVPEPRHRADKDSSESTEAESSNAQHNGRPTKESSKKN